MPVLLPGHTLIIANTLRSSLSEYYHNNRRQNNAQTTKAREKISIQISSAKKLYAKSKMIVAIAAEEQSKQTFHCCSKAHKLCPWSWLNGIGTYFDKIFLIAFEVFQRQIGIVGFLFLGSLSIEIRCSRICNFVMPRNAKYQKY